jgi:Zn-dependent peptidase ImmA (M78 family)
MTEKQEKSILEKLQNLRQEKGFSAKEVATAMGFASHKSLKDIELGRKKLTEPELQKLAHIYGIPVQDLYIKNPEIPNFKHWFSEQRALSGAQIQNLLKKLFPNIKLYFDLIKEIYPNTLLQEGYKHWMKKEYSEPSNKMDAINQGELLADQLRKGLDLGHGPITNILFVCELLNIITLFLDFESSDISSFYCEYQEVPLIIINSHIDAKKKKFSIAHELCHFLVDNSLLSQSPVLTKNFNPFEEKNNRNYREVRANAFASSFLMPEAGLKFYLKQLFGKTSKSVSVYDVLNIAYHYEVSFQTVSYRLKNLDLISDPIYEDLKSFEASADTIREKIFGCHNFYDSCFMSSNNFDSRLKRIAIEAFQQGVLNLNTLCEVFGSSVREQKKLLQQLQLQSPKPACH